VNIDPAKVATVPQRVPPPEATSRANGASTRAAGSPDQPALTTNAVESTKRLQSGDDAGRKKSAELSVEEAVQRLADFLKPTQAQITFSIDSDSGLRVVKVLDLESKEVIRQFPSEEAIALAQALDKIQGLLIKDKA